MTQHPSGRPVRSRIIKGYSQIRGTLDGFVVSKLNAPEPSSMELVGGFGFRLPEEPEDPMYLETRAMTRPN